MASADQYAAWIVANKHKRGTPEFDTVANAYKLARAEESAPVASNIQEESPTSGKNIVGAATEPLLQLGTGAVATPVAGLSGILAGLSKSLGITDADPADVVRKVSEAMTYEPKTVGGQNASSVITAPLKALAEGGDYLGGKAAELTGSPAIGAAINAATQAVVPAVVGRAKIIGGPTGRVGEVIDKAVDVAAKPVTYPANKMADIINSITGPARETWRTEQGRQFIEDMVGKDKIPMVRDMVKNTDSIIPNSPMTVGDRVTQSNMGAENIVGSPIVAIEKRLSGLPGGVSDIAKSIESTKQGLRKGAVDEIAGTKEALAEAVKKRSVNAAINYGEAYQNIVKADPELAQLASDPYFKEALPDAFKEAKHRGIDPKKNMTEFLQFVKMSLDGELGKTGESSLKNMQKASVTDVKKQLLDWMDKKNPDYKMARQTFASDSGPVNQMEFGQSLQSALTGATGKERQLAFNAAVEKAKNTIDKNTNKPVFDDLNPKQKESIQRVTDELTRDTFKDELGTNQKVDNVFSIAEKGKGGMTLPAMLWSPATITNWIMKRMGHGADERIAQDMGKMMFQDPEAFAGKYLADKPLSARERVIAEIMRNRNPALGTAVGANERKQ